MATPTPVPCTQTVLLQGIATLPARTVDYETVSVTSSGGRLDVIFDWTNLTSTMAFYVVNFGTCPINSFNARSCNFLVVAEGTSKPRKATLNNVAPGSYHVLFANFNTKPESVSTQVFFKTSTCPAITSAGTATTSTTSDTVEHAITH